MEGCAGLMVTSTAGCTGGPGNEEGLTGGASSDIGCTEGTGNEEGCTWVLVSRKVVPDAGNEEGCTGDVGNVEGCTADIGNEEGGTGGAGNEDKHTRVSVLFMKIKKYRSSTG